MTGSNAIRTSPIDRSPRRAAEAPARTSSLLDGINSTVKTGSVQTKMEMRTPSAVSSDDLKKIAVVGSDANKNASKLISRVQKRSSHEDDIEICELALEYSKNNFREALSYIKNIFKYSGEGVVSEKLKGTLLSVHKNRLNTEKLPYALLLLGSSTAGKTTLSNRLMADDSSLINRGIDITCGEEWNKKFLNFVTAQSKKLGKEVENDWKYLLSVRNPKCYVANVLEGFFADGLGVEDQKKAQAAAERVKSAFIGNKMPLDNFFESNFGHHNTYLLNDVLEKLENGESVVFDVVDKKNMAGHPLTLRPELTKLLVHLPIKTLSERIEGRNANAKKNDQPNEERNGIFPFEQYLNFFGPRENEPSGDVVEIITKKDVLHIFDKHFPHVDAFDEYQMTNNKLHPQLHNFALKNNLDPEDLNPVNIINIKEKHKETNKNKLLTGFGFSPNDADTEKRELVPKVPHDYLVSTENKKAPSAFQAISVNAALQKLHVARFKQLFSLSSDASS
jgi:hypothetical protein